MVEISVIMPVYNCEKYLDESVRSILNQTFSDFELICVDDGSKDNSLSILEEFAKDESRMKVFHQENKGGGIARNFALSKATGRFICFVDADDILDEVALNETYELITETDADFVMFKAVNFDDDKKRYYETEYFSMNEIYESVGNEAFHYSDLGDLIFKLSVTPWGKLYSRELILKSEAEFAGGMYHDNKFFWRALLNSEKIIFYNKCLYTRRIHSESLQSSDDEKILYIFDAFDAIFDIFIDEGEYDKYKYRLYNWKMDSFHCKFFQIRDDLKPMFLKRLKQDFLKMIGIDGEDDVKSNLNSDYEKVFHEVMACESDMEFKLLAEKYNLNKKVIKLQKENNRLRRKNREILNSRSWNITKPLRKIKNLR